MDILELLKEKILKDFPAISEEELHERIKIGEKLIKNLSGHHAQNWNNVHLPASVSR